MDVEDLESLQVEVVVESPWRTISFRATRALKDLGRRDGGMEVEVYNYAWLASGIRTGAGHHWQLVLSVSLKSLLES